MARALTLLARTADTSLLLMRGHINYRPKSNCQQARCRWALPFPKMETSFTSQQVAETQLRSSIRRRMKWRQQFLSEIVPGESRSTRADRSSTQQMAHQTTSQL